MSRNKKRAILDDGCCPELVSGAKFDGILEIPIIERPKRIFIPKQIAPFSVREKVENFRETAIGCFEMDPNFSDLLRIPKNYIMDLSRFGAFISPDCSLYRDAPLSTQITNTYRNRAVGHYFQKKGVNVIPQIRWGGKESFTKSVLPEKLAFLGVEKHSIVSIGTYGCIQHREDKYFFKAGLEAMLETLEPIVVLVYGSMPNEVFGDYLHLTQFVQFDDWTKIKHGGKK